MGRVPCCNYTEGPRFFRSSSLQADLGQSRMNLLTPVCSGLAGEAAASSCRRADRAFTIDARRTMSKTMQRFGLVALIVTVLCAASPAQAQGFKGFNFNPNGNQNPNFFP